MLGPMKVCSVNFHMSYFHMFVSWPEKPVPTVLAPISVPGKKVPTVPVHGSGSVPVPSCYLLRRYAL